MKIGILTHYQVESHGALLQMYALSRYLQKLGHDVVILTYEKNFDFADEESKNKFSMSISSIPFYLSEYLIKKGPGIVVSSISKHRKLKQFLEKNFVLQPYDSAQCDLAIVGADEVFSLELGINKPMFGYGVSAARIASYAPSFGQTDIERIKRFDCVDVIRNGLNAFDAVSVRDEHSKKTVEQLIGIQVPIVCDPALLYDFRDELSNLKRPTKSRYIAIYSYNTYMNEPEKISSIRKYAKERGLEIYSVGSYHKWCDRQISCEPLEMLDWFYGAEYVITDTFHGTIGSLLVKTPAAIYVRNTNNVKMDHLLKTLGISSRKVGEARELSEVLESKMDFKAVDSAIASFRESGVRYLDRVLTNE